jgi:hypothetical protein
MLAIFSPTEKSVLWLVLCESFHLLLWVVSGKELGEEKEWKDSRLRFRKLRRCEFTSTATTAVTMDMRFAITIAQRN